MTIEASKIYDPIKGGDVVGNVLDQVHSPTYNLKLYMIPPTEAPASTTDQSSDQSGDAARADTSSANSTSSSVIPFVAPPDKTVVLAQTGVTGAQIDNLTIETAQPTPGAPLLHNRFRFDIIQPGAADFMDQIIMAKKYLGMETKGSDFPLILEIVFKGYRADPNDEDAGGEPITVAGPYRFSIGISKVSVEITSEGSIYSFECAGIASYAYTDMLYRVPKKIETIGTTIEEHLADYEKKINDYLKTNYTDYKVHDEIKIDLSGLKKPSKYGLDDLSLITSDAVRAEEINRIMNPELEGKTEDEYKAILEESAKDEGKLDIVVSENKITVREGITFERYMFTLLSMNDEFFSKISRKANPKDPADSTVNKNLPYVNWAAVDASTAYIGFDSTRNTYAKKIILKPYIYASTKTTVQVTAEENRNLAAADIRARLDAMNIQKAYHYLFTGLNDQIINCNIRYDNGITILQAPAGGVTGDFSTVMAKSLTSEAAQSDDMTNANLAKAALGLSLKDKLLGGIDKLMKFASDSDILSIGSVLNMAKDQISDAITNRTGLNAKIIKDVLSETALAEAIYQATLTAGKKNTSSDNIQNLDGTPYTFKPKNSEFIYAADLINGLDQRSDSSASLEDAQQRAAELRSQAEAAGEVEEFDANVGPEESITQGNNPNLTEDATYDGSPKNTIFGYLMQQQTTDAFLMNLELEIKGDPWYFGPTDSKGYEDAERSGSENVADTDTSIAANIKGSEINILFDMQTPRRFDFDVAEEDNNTGYWSQKGTSYFISGVYMLLTYVSEFSGGEFKQRLKLAKQTPIQLSRIQPEAEQTTEE